MADLLDQKAKPARLKASDITAAMAKRWSAPEWAIMWEVGEGTGTRSGRFADAVMMSLWPSRGLELHGVEIKVSRSDWKREAANPEKAEAIAKYCDRWWVHTPPGVVDDLSDLPPAWGLREFNGRTWSTIREADKTPAEQIGRTFLAALLRRADGATQSLMREAIRDAREAGYAEIEKMRGQVAMQIEDGIKRRTEDLSTQAERVSAFEAAFGKGSLSRWDCHPEAWGKAARALSEVGNDYGNLINRLRKAADEIEALQRLAGETMSED